MKKSIIIPVVFVVTLIMGCSAKSNNERSYFVSSEKRGLIVPIKINDSISVKMLFDTGASYGLVKLDSTLCAQSSMFANAKEPGKKLLLPLNTWAGHKPEFWRTMVRHEYPITVNIGGCEVQYGGALVQDIKSDFAVDADGLLAFPRNDSTHVWELNFSNDYMEVHKVTDFKMPTDCYVLPLVNGPQDNLPFVRFPIKIKNSEGDTTTIEETYLVDTGLTQDIVLMATNTKNVGFFDKMDDAVLIRTAAAYRSRYIVDSEIFNDMKIDSLRFYIDKFGEPMIRAGYSGILGLNFLKRFNLFFDFKNKQLGFQPIGKFVRFVDPNIQKFYYDASMTKDQKFIVTLVGDTKDNPYKEAGLRVEDEIVAVNGVDIKDWLSGKYKETAEDKMNPWACDILRNGKKLQLTIQRINDGWVGD